MACANDVVETKPPDYSMCYICGRGLNLRIVACVKDVVETKPPYYSMCYICGRD